MELVAAIPALLLAGLLALQLLARRLRADPRRRRRRGGRAGARRRAGRRRARRARPCPAGRTAAVEVSVRGGEVTVRLVPPSPFPALADRLAVTSSAFAREAGAMSEAVILVTAVGAASGSKAAAAALACAGSEPDRPGLLIDLGGRPPRPTLVASAGARELEERLAVHLPQLRAASRGQTCHLAVPGEPEAFESVRAALPLVRDSVAVIHLPPARLQEALADAGIRLTGAMLRADLGRGPCPHRARGPRSGRPRPAHEGRRSTRSAGSRPAARCSASCSPGAPGGLPPSLLDSLLESEISAEHVCYGGSDDEEADPTGTAQQQRRGHAGARRGARTSS